MRITEQGGEIYYNEYIRGRSRRNYSHQAMAKKGEKI